MQISTIIRKVSINKARWCGYIPRDWAAYRWSYSNDHELTNVSLSHMPLHSPMSNGAWTLERWSSEQILGSSPYNSKLSWTDNNHNYGALSNTKWYKLLMSETFSNISTACTMAVSAPIVFENLWMRIPMSSNPAHHIDVIMQYIGCAFYIWKLINANVKDRNPAWNSSWWILLSSL